MGKSKLGAEQEFRVCVKESLIMHTYNTGKTLMGRDMMLGIPINTFLLILLQRIISFIMLMTKNNRVLVLTLKLCIVH